MSGFQKKKPIENEPVSGILSAFAGEKGVLGREVILQSAMFWDSKKRMGRIRSLMLSGMQLEVFEDTADFKVDELSAIELLSLSKNKLIHLQPLQVLQSLICLNVSHNRVYDLSALSHLTLLQELYASHNHISHIDSLAANSQLKILNLFENKITLRKSLIATLSTLSLLEDLDIENNPAYSEDFRRELIRLPLLKLNGSLIKRDEKEAVLSLSAVFIQRQGSFWHSSDSKLQEKLTEFAELEEKYALIDDQFESEILKNVALKEQFHTATKAYQEWQRRRENSKGKAEQVKLLRRKVKAMKDQLFTLDTKGKLLKGIFEMDMTVEKQEGQKPKIREQVWERKFDWDEVITIEENEQDSRYFEDDSQLGALLDGNSKALSELRKELLDLQ